MEITKFSLLKQARSRSAMLNLNGTSGLPLLATEQTFRLPADMARKLQNCARTETGSLATVGPTMTVHLYEQELIKPKKSAL